MRVTYQGGEELASYRLYTERIKTETYRCIPFFKYKGEVFCKKNNEIIIVPLHCPCLFARELLP